MSLRKLSVPLQPSARCPARCRPCASLPVPVPKVRRPGLKRDLYHCFLYVNETKGELWRLQNDLLCFCSAPDIFPDSSGLLRSQSPASCGSVVGAVAGGNKFGLSTDSQLGASEGDSKLSVPQVLARDVSSEMNDCETEADGGA